MSDDRSDKDDVSEMGGSGGSEEDFRRDPEDRKIVIVDQYRSRSKERSRSRSPSLRKSKRKYSRSRSRSRSRGRSRREKSSRSRRHHSRSYSRSVSYSPPPYRRGRRSHSRSPMSNRRRHYGNRDNPEPTRCLGVFGLSIYTTEQQLHHIFSKYGVVENVQVVMDAKTGQSRGFCFVYFDNFEDARLAKEQCTGMEIDGRKIRVDYSITQRAHTPTPGIYMGKPTYSDRRYPRSRDWDRDRDYYGGGGGGGGYRGGGGGGRYRSPSPYYHSSRSRRRYDKYDKYERYVRYSRSRSRSYSPVFSHSDGDGDGTNMAWKTPFSPPAKHLATPRPSVPPTQALNFVTKNY